MCEQQYFIEYVLGWRGPSNQKADKGTIVHKVLELLAVIKKAQQDKLISVDDDIAGKILVNNYDLENLFTIVYEHYIKSSPHHKWTEKDRKDCRNWVDKTLSFNNGMFDPRNRDIVCPEQHFDFIIDKPWAKYSFDTPEGKLEGNLALKGTVDLITKIDDNFFEIVDWKTGRRLDWATGKEKTQEKLENDPQLRIYHYAIQQLYPEIDHIMVTINFINDGGPFSICFEKSDLQKTEHMIRAKFDKIQKVKKPSLNKSWMCSKLCHFGKTTFDNTSIEPLEEYRDGQLTRQGSIMSKCEQIHHDIQMQGMGEVVQKYKHPNHSFGFYKAPGE
jgi:hypothetical protein